VINVDHVPLSFDAELPRNRARGVTRTRGGRFSIGINNRQGAAGFYARPGASLTRSGDRIADKLDKIGPTRSAIAGHD